MFKFFGVADEKNMVELDDDIKDSGFDEESDIETEVGQVALDILETPHELIILAPIAGIELSDIDLSFNKSVLTIKGYRKKPEIYSEEIIVRNTECFWGKFIRNVILPDNLDFDTIKANLENNLLVITIKKLEFESQSIKIDRIEG